MDSKVDPASSEASEIRGSPPKAPPVANTSSKVAEQAEDTIKVGDVNKEVVQGADLPPLAPKDLSTEKETSQNMELVLATLAIPPKEFGLPHFKAFINECYGYFLSSCDFTH